MKSPRQGRCVVCGDRIEGRRKGARIAVVPADRMKESDTAGAYGGWPVVARGTAVNYRLYHKACVPGGPRQTRALALRGGR